MISFQEIDTSFFQSDGTLSYELGSTDGKSMLAIIKSTMIKTSPSFLVQDPYQKSTKISSIRRQSSQFSSKKLLLTIRILKKNRLMSDITLFLHQDYNNKKTISSVVKSCGKKSSENILASQSKGE